MKTNVTIVIPNWNGADFIAEALTSLQQQTLQHKVIVVDNGSSDDSVSIIRKEFPHVRLLEFKDNAGFSGGVNRGIQPALEDGADFIALFNNDATADPNWLAQLVSAAEDQPSAGIVTGKLLHTDGDHIDSTGEFYTIWGMPFPRDRNQKDTGQRDIAQNIFGGTGGASLYRAKMLKQIGLFDEDFFVYFEDIDLSFRAQLAGWKVWLQPSAIAYHRVSASCCRHGCSVPGGT
jgi:GT2 family glycosyltransferase